MARRCVYTRTFARALCATALFACGMVPQLSAQTIDTRTGQSKYAVTTPSYGQVFTTPLGVVALTQFSFFLQPNVANVGETASFSAFVMAWNGSRPTGALLYDSGVRVTPGCCGIVESVFNTGALNVTPGAMYIAFLTPAAGSTLVEGFASAAGDYTDSYAGGYFAFNPSCPDTPGTCDWARSNSIPNLDMEFVAKFSSFTNPGTVVPEPATVFLFATGLACVLLYHSRRSLRRSA